MCPSSGEYDEPIVQKRTQSTDQIAVQPTIAEEPRRIETDQSTTESTDSPPKKLNVLFIVVDDLRPQLSPYKGPNFPNPESTLDMFTPNIANLADKSLLLTRAYVQYSLCGPSRTSLLTGRRPDTTKVWDLKTYWRESAGDFVTLPQYFKNNGYVAAATGKIFDPRNSQNQDAKSWTFPVVPLSDNWNHKRVHKTWRSISIEERAADPLRDDKVLETATSFLRTFARDPRNPFFLGVGFYKPHLPFACPKKFMDMYPKESLDALDNEYVPLNYPNDAFFPRRELLDYYDIQQLNFSAGLNETMDLGQVEQMRRAYYGCVSYIDSLVGDLLKTLDELDLTNSTIVSFIGDHGWHLGENGFWAKNSNFEQGTHAPMMIRIPGKTDPGIQSESLVEFIDLFPTLAEAAGLEKIPPCPRESSNVVLCSDGLSFLRLVQDPYDRIKNATFSQIKNNKFTGYSIRTDRYRYTEWVPFEKTRQPDGSKYFTLPWNSSLGVELYDHHLDPLENVNRAGYSSYGTVKNTLREQLINQIGSVI